MGKDVRTNAADGDGQEQARTLSPCAVSVTGKTELLYLGEIWTHTLITHI